MSQSAVMRHYENMREILDRQARREREYLDRDRGCHCSCEPKEKEAKREK